MSDVIETPNKSPFSKALQIGLVVASVFLGGVFLYQMFSMDASMSEQEQVQKQYSESASSYASSSSTSESASAPAENKVVEVELPVPKSNIAKGAQVAETDIEYKKLKLSSELGLYSKSNEVVGKTAKFVLYAGQPLDHYDFDQ